MNITKARQEFCERTERDFSANHTTTMNFNDSKPKLAIVRELPESDSAVTEINRLHQSFCVGLRTTLQIAIQIGELLVEQKNKCQHGEWIPWIKANLEFGQSTAKRYIRCYYKQTVPNRPLTGDLTIEEFAKIADEPSEEEIKEMNSAIEEAKIAWLKNPDLSIRALAKQENLGHGTVQKARTILIAAGEFPQPEPAPKPAPILPSEPAPVIVPAVVNPEIPNSRTPIDRVKDIFREDPAISASDAAVKAGVHKATAYRAKQQMIAAGELGKVKPAKIETKTNEDIISEKLRALWGHYGYSSIRVETIDSLLSEIYIISSIAGVKTAQETWERVRKELKLRGPEHNIKIRIPSF